MIRRFLRDPLAHFLAAGAVIWSFLALAGDPVDPAERSITLTREQQAGLALGFERTMGRPPTDAELDAQIARWLREEILYREALRLGLDRGDPIVRRRLAAKMDELASAEAETAAVPDAVLAQWLRDHPERFSEGERFTFSQEYYPDKDAMMRAVKGDKQAYPISLPARIERGTYDEVQAVFGSRFAEQLAALRVGGSAQVPSGYGWHVVDLQKREVGRERPLEEIRERVEDDWRSSTAAARREQAFELLQEAYRIEVE